MIAYYQILLAISVVLTMLYFLSWHKHFDVHVTLIFLLIPIAILGNVLTARSTVMEEAIAANKITYFGGTYLLLMITLSILNLCEIILPRMLRFAMFLVSTMVYFGSLTVGDKTWFYKSCSFTVEDGCGRLTFHFVIIVNIKSLLSWVTERIAFTNLDYTISWLNSIHEVMVRRSFASVMT